MVLVKYKQWISLTRIMFKNSSAALFFNSAWTSIKNCTNSLQKRTTQISWVLLSTLSISVRRSHLNNKDIRGSPCFKYFSLNIHYSSTSSSNKITRNFIYYFNLGHKARKTKNTFKLSKKSLKYNLREYLKFKRWHKWIDNS